MAENRNIKVHFRFYFFPLKTTIKDIKQKQIEMRYSEGVSQRILKKLQDAVASEELILEFVQVGSTEQ